MKRRSRFGEITGHDHAKYARDQISARTKAALTAAKARGVILGSTGRANLQQNLEARRTAASTFAGKLSGVLHGFIVAGMTQRQMVAQLNTLQIRAARGGAWSLAQVQRVMARIDICCHQT